MGSTFSNENLQWATETDEVNLPSNVYQILVCPLKIGDQQQTDLEKAIDAV